jgi:hypothetical protein
VINITVDAKLAKKQIEDAILDQLKIKLSRAFQVVVHPIKARLQTLCDTLISSSETYSALLSGHLLGELGVPNVQGRMDAIVTAIKNSLEVSYQPVVRRGDNLYGGLAISILRSDFQDVLSLSSASYTTQKGQTIPWLDWLIVQGDRIIVIGYDVDLTLTVSEQIRSRTGLALMKKGSGWRVPPEFSGTPESNFLTKTFNFSGIEDVIAKIVEEEVLLAI